MSKQEFSRLDVLLRVQSGRLRVSDACVLIGLQRRQVFRLLRGSSRTAPRAYFPSAAANPATTVYPLRFAPGAIDPADAVFRLWSELGGREAGRASRLFVRAGLCAVELSEMGYGRTVGVVSPSPHQPRRRRDPWANWCRSTARSTPGSRTAGPPFALLTFVMIRRAG